MGPINTQIKELFTVLILFIVSINTATAQEAAKDDTWYVWMDTEVNNSQTRIVSEVFVINCCVKSPKYRKLVKKAGKWIRKNVDESYAGTDPLKKIQDEQLAREMMIRTSTRDNVKLVDYSGSCQ